MVGLNVSFYDILRYILSLSLCTTLVSYLHMYICIIRYTLALHEADVCICTCTLFTQVIVTLAATFGLGVITARRTTFSTFWALPVLCLYPLSIILVHVLDEHFGLQ